MKTKTIFILLLASIFYHNYSQELKINKELNSRFNDVRQELRWEKFICDSTFSIYNLSNKIKDIYYSDKDSLRKFLRTYKIYDYNVELLEFKVKDLTDINQAWLSKNEKKVYSLIDDPTFNKINLCYKKDLFNYSVQILFTQNKISFVDSIWFFSNFQNDLSPRKEPTHTIIKGRTNEKIIYYSNVNNLSNVGDDIFNIIKLNLDGSFKIDIENRGYQVIFYDSNKRILSIH